MEAMQIFRNNQFGEVRVTEVNGELYFVAKDVAERLGYITDKGMGQILSHVPAEWKSSTPNPNGGADMITLSEQGLYFFLARSDKPAALPFQKWIAGEVIPSIRRHGAYATPATIDAIIADPEFGIKLLSNLKEERQKRLEAETKVKEQAPKVLFADAVATSHKSCLISELAKIITQNGVEIGQNRLFEWMRQHGYLCSKGGYYNQPTQKAMELGLFEIKKTSITKPDGCVLVTCTTKVTGKGQIYFINKLLTLN